MEFIGKAKALFDYAAADVTILSFKQGDIINIIGKDASGWWSGSVRGAVGYFPSNFVEEIPDNPAIRKISDNVAARKSSRGASNPAPSSPRADYTAPDEQLNPPESIPVDESFSAPPVPPTIVEETTEYPSSGPVNIPAIPPPAPESKKLKALFDREAASENEIAFKTGDIVVVTDETSADWWTGELNGQVGYFPVNHFEPVKETTRSSMSVTSPKASTTKPTNNVASTDQPLANLTSLPTSAPKKSKNSIRIHVLFQQPYFHLISAYLTFDQRGSVNDIIEFIKRSVIIKTKEEVGLYHYKYKDYLGGRWLTNDSIFGSLDIPEDADIEFRLKKLPVDPIIAGVEVKMDGWIYELRPSQLGKSWKRRWVLLGANKMQIFEKLDDNKVPKNLKEEVLLGGCNIAGEIKLDYGRPQTFTLVPRDAKPIVLSALTDIKTKEFFDITLTTIKLAVEDILLKLEAKKDIPTTENKVIKTGWLIKIGKTFGSKRVWLILTNTVLIMFVYGDQDSFFFKRAEKLTDVELEHKKSNLIIKSKQNSKKITIHSDSPEVIEQWKVVLTVAIADNNLLL